MAWAATKSSSLTSAGCAGRLEMTQPSGRFHRCTLLCPRVTLPGSASSVSVRCRFHTCRPVYRGFSRMVVTVPSVHPAPVRCVLRPGSAADGHGTPASFSARAIRATECPARRWAKIHRTMGAVARVGFQPVRAPSPRGVRLVRVRPRVREPVPVRRAAAEVPALLPGLDGHRGADPDAGPGDLPLGRQPQHRHRLLIMLGRVVDPAAGLRHPQLHAVVLEQRRHRRVLAAVERPLVLPDHDRVPPPVRVSELGDQRGGLRAAGPRHLPGLPDVEELRHDLPVTADQRLGLLPLPRPRRRRILPVLGRHPPVEHEPQPARNWPFGHYARPAARRPLSPSEQPAITGHDLYSFPAAKFNTTAIIPEIVPRCPANREIPSASQR